MSEHHPICAWCKFGSRVQIAIIPKWWCSERANVSRVHDHYRYIKPVDIKTMARNVFSLGQCDNYSPSVSTRALQLVRIRPFVARIRDGSKHPRVRPPSNPAPPRST